jgi:hypothetical protein
MKTLFQLVGILSALGLAATAFGDNGLGNDAKHAANDVKKTAKKTARSVKDKTCEMVDGKLSCAGKKLKHKAQNAADDVKND